MDVSFGMTVVVVHGYLHLPKLTNLCTLNVCSLLYVNYTPIKPYKRELHDFPLRVLATRPYCGQRNSNPSLVLSFPL